MKPIQYCYDLLVDTHSSVYYALKKTPPEKRDSIVAIAAFYQEIETILLNSVDTSVAQQKLYWWRSDLIKMTNGSPEHPVVQALQQQQIQKIIDLSRFFEIIDGIAENIPPAPFETFEDIVVQIMRTAGLRELMFRDVLQLKEIIAEEPIYQITLMLELTHYIQHLRRFVKRGLLYFPENEMRQFQVTQAMLEEYRTTPEVMSLLKFEANKIERALSNAIAALSPSEIKLIDFLLTRAEIARLTLTEIATSGFSVLENLIYLTPLRMWWISYRR